MEEHRQIRIGFIGTNNDKSDIKWAHENGLPHIEYNYAGDWDENYAHATQLHIDLRRHLVHPCAVGCWGLDFIGPGREEAREVLRKTIDFAHAIQSPLVMTGGGNREGGDLKPKLKDVVSAYEGMVDYAGEREVRLAFYNCHWNNCVVGPEAWDVVLKELPGVGIKFDPSHPYQNGGHDPYVQLAAYAEHVFHVHAKEVLTVDGETFDEPMAGMGDFHWGKIIGILYKAGYNGVISIEPHSKTWSGAMRHPGILIAKRELERFLV